MTSSFRDHAVEKIGAIEGADQHRGIVEPQLLDDIAAHALGGGRGVGVKAGVAKTRLQLRQLAVFQPEVMAPLTDAMRLVDRERADAQTRGKLEKTRRKQPFRCDEYKVMTARGDLALGTAKLGEIHPAMQRDGRIAAGAQRIDLVLHQRDERRHHDIGASGDRRRRLVAERLTAPGRHHHQRVAALKPRPDRLRLKRPQRLKAPEAAHSGENRVSRILRHVHHRARRAIGRSGLKSSRPT